MSKLPTGTSLATRVIRTDWRPRLLCAAGALAAIGLASWLFDANNILSHFISLLIHLTTETLSVVSAVWSSATEALCTLPWYLIFPIVGLACSYLGCRFARGGALRPYLVSTGVLLLAWMGYLAGLRADADLLAQFRDGFMCATVFAIMLSIGIARKGAKSTITASGFLSAGLAAVSAVLSLCHVADASDTFPDATALVQARYGAELTQMGFLDTNRNNVGSTGHCDGVDIVFSSGEVSAAAPSVWPFDSSLSERPACIALRMRNGRLTMIAPGAPAGTTREAAEAATLAAVDANINSIRNAYATVQEKARIRSTWEHEPRSALAETAPVWSVNERTAAPVSR